MVLLLVLLGIAQLVLLLLIWAGLGELAVCDRARQSWQADRDILRMEHQTIQAMFDVNRQDKGDVIDGTAVERRS